MTVQEKRQLKKLIENAFTKKQLVELAKSMDQLACDEDIKARRFACRDEVIRIIEISMKKRLDAVNEKLQKEFSSGKEPTRDELTVFFQENLGLSHDNAYTLAGKYRYNLSAPTENAFINAAEAVKKALLKNEKSAFAKELAKKGLLSESKFSKFINAKYYTSDEKVKLIADELIAKGLVDEEWKNKLVSKNIQEHFIMNEAVSDETEKRMTSFIKSEEIEVKTYEAKRDFCTYEVGISLEALKKFNLSMFGRENPTPEETVEHYELLKLIAFFGMEETAENKEASEFLEKAGRSFATGIDLAFLTAITKGYEFMPKKSPLYVALITHYLSEDEDLDLEIEIEIAEHQKFKSPYNKMEYITEAAIREGLL